MQPAGPGLCSLPTHSCPAGTVWPLLVSLSLLRIPLHKLESCVNSFSLCKCAKDVGAAQHGMAAAPAVVALGYLVWFLVCRESCIPLAGVAIEDSV